MSGYVYGCEALVIEAGSGVILLRGTHSELGAVSAWLRGSDIGTALDQLTAFALADKEQTGLLEIGGFGRLSKKQSHRLLPRLVRAAIGTASTPDKNEAMMLRGPEDPPTDPFCHVCGHGTNMSTRDGDWPGRCDQRGHEAFGAKEDETWEESLERHRREKSRWQFRSDMRLIAPMTPLAR